MANYIATDTDLTAVANAIRTKGGTSAELVFPTGFVNAIGDISGGGFTLVGSSEFQVTTASTAAVDVGTIDCGSEIVDKNTILLIEINRKEGAASGYYYGAYILFVQNSPNFVGGIPSFFGGITMSGITLGAAGKADGIKYGISPKSSTQALSSSGVLSLIAKTDGNITVDGTFVVNVYSANAPW